MQAFSRRRLPSERRPSLSFAEMPHCLDLTKLSAEELHAFITQPQQSETSSDENDSDEEVGNDFDQRLDVTNSESSEFEVCYQK